jgi:hypothetical protein
MVVYQANISAEIRLNICQVKTNEGNQPPNLKKQGKMRQNKKNSRTPMQFAMQYAKLRKMRGITAVNLHSFGHNESKRFAPACSIFTHKSAGGNAPKPRSGHSTKHTACSLK